jgi:methanogenic corrinoid protein MtbC1
MTDELDLNSLNDDELIGQMHEDLYDGLKDEIEQGVSILLGRGRTPYDVLARALVEAMRIVGDDFRDGILFVPEVLMSANAMKADMAILRPLLPYVVMGNDPNCAAFIRKYREPDSPEVAARGAGRREGGRRRARG